jgi:hypothetical protein
MIIEYSLDRGHVQSLTWPPTTTTCSVPQSTATTSTLQTELKILTNDFHLRFHHLLYLTDDM